MLKENNTLVIFFYLITTLIFSSLFLGFENLSFTNSDWLLNSGDKTNSHISWTFFRNDFWHFPIGKNPNYGLDIANSIIFTDSIPILAFFLKFLVLFFQITFNIFLFGFFYVSFYNYILAIC